ncbi:cyclin-like protein [Calycina marina]|uniref:RNA polymerase II holoenzyme cyclin-like subunit n=1 Tax=Calycina marina TaxID=1763456 RepID=A0A9P8CE34_9HELO|nr:cyclin-like protein [Calycina marina]
MAPATTSPAQPAQPVGPVGPESLVKVSTQYYFQQEINIKLVASGSNTQREEQYRIQGIQLLHDIRNALQLPAQTFTCAARYYHRFRMEHKDSEYQWQDAAVAALLCACKIEDTLKKSRDILCAMHNYRSSEQLSPDDPRFNSPSAIVLGLERLMLESSKFDFRNRTPHRSLLKLAKYLALPGPTTKLALAILNDSYKTWAPMKQTCTAMAFACLELACHLLNRDLEQIHGSEDIANKYEELGCLREEVMETLLDMTELYTHCQKFTTVGMMWDVDIFIQIRIHLNREMSEHNFERFCHSIDPATALAKLTPKTPITPASPEETRTNGHTNGQASGNGNSNGNFPSPSSSGGSKGVKQDTVRFMLEREQAREEQAVVERYWKVEYEEYEIEIEEPIPVAPVHHGRDRQGGGGYRGRDRGYHGHGHGKRGRRY